MAESKKLKFFPIEVDYKVVDNKAVIHLFGRSANNERVCVIDRDFEPYFYAKPEEGVNPDSLAKELKDIRIKIGYNEYYIKKIEVAAKKIEGKEEKVLKIFANLPRGVTAIKDSIKNRKDVERCFEHNILFARRYLIDRKITPFTLSEAEGNFGISSMKVPVFEAKKVQQAGDDVLDEPRTLAFDIETYNPEDSIDADKNAIIMISFYGKSLKKVITWKKFPAKEKFIHFVDSEMELLEEAARTIDKYQPDIITGYFSDGFDLPYIKKRAEKYKLKLRLGLDNSEIQLRGKDGDDSSIMGIAHIDIFKFIRRVISMKMKTDSFDLDSVARELIGKGKYKVELEKMADVWDNEPKKLEPYCIYNLQDSELTYLLFEKVFPNLIELVKIIGLKPFDIIRMGFGQLVENYLIRMALDFDIIIPNKPSFKEALKRRSETYTGAFVFEPKPGLYKDIIIFDFRSLYPTIISSHNISTETLNCSCCMDRKKVPLEDEMLRPKMLHGKKELWFCTKKKGFISSVIEDIIERRQRVKEIMKKTKDKSKLQLLDARQYALKILSNSFYGYLGFTQARWYSNEAAMSVTAYGRDYIHKVIESAGKAGFDVIYSDTDSIFITLGEKKKEDALKLLEDINKDLPGLMELEYEGDYPAGLFVSAKIGAGGAKKRYALIDSKGDLEIKGFESVRRNASFIAKEVQESVLRTILAENNPEKALNHVRKVIKDIKEHKIPLDKMVIITQLTKDIEEYEAVGPHVAIAKKMRAKGHTIVPGMLIRFVIAKGKGRIRDKAMLLDECKQSDYDPEYYISNQILPAIEKIFEVLGYSKEDVTGEKKQSKLGSFF